MSIIAIDPCANDQADLCVALMKSLRGRIHERVWNNERTSYDMPQPLTNAALERQITTLRMELLELQRIIRA